MIATLRLLALVAYLPLAYLAGARQSQGLAATALALLVFLVLADALRRGRPAAWAVALACGAGIALLVREGWALLPLWLVPSVFMALVATVFARTLRRPRIPLITRVVAALYGQPVEQLSPLHIRYTRGLTAAWATLLYGLAALNLTLAMVATPDGLLASVGVQAPVTVTRDQWSFLANIANYGVLGGFMVLEYIVRRRVFATLPYRNFAEFARRMAGLGPAFWRDVLR